MKPINVGLLGIGTVGRGTFKVLQRNSEEISRRAGCSIRMTVVADKDTARAKSIVGDAARVTGDANEVVSGPDIDIVVELIGGYGIAKELILKAIANGKATTPTVRPAIRLGSQCWRCNKPARRASSRAIKSDQRRSDRMR